MHRTAATVALLATVSAHAESPFETYSLQDIVPHGTYLHINAGKTIKTNWCEDLPGEVHCKGRPYVAYGGLGLSVSDALAVELGYFGSQDVIASAGALAVNAEVSAWLLSGLAAWPISPASALYGRLGAARWSVQTDGTVSGQLILQGSARGWSPVLGIGARFAAAGALTVRAEYSYLHDVGDENETGQTDLHLLMVGVEVRF